MKKVFHLSTCNTCQRILGEVNLIDFEIQNVKEKHITQEELVFLRTKVGSYHDLLNKRAQKYRSMDLKNRNLVETEIQQIILQEYTLLKRPIFIIGSDVFIGNAKKTIEALKEHLG